MTQRRIGRAARIGAMLAFGAWPAVGALGREPDEPKKPVTATVKAERGPIVVELNLKGVIQPAEAREVGPELESWSQPLVVQSAAPHGARVEAGDVVLEFEADAIDRAVAEQAIEHDLARLALKAAEEDLPLLERSTPIDLAAAERALAEAREDLGRFLEIDRPLAVESAEFGVRQARRFLENAEENLAQLEKMYRSKDLTEETEEIILKRQRFDVEQGRFGLQSAETRRDQTLKVDLPRRETAAREAVEKADIDLARARSGLPATLTRKRLELEKQRHDTRRAAEKRDELARDRESFTLRAPIAGVVYHGRYAQGEWSTPTATAKLQPGASIPASTDPPLTVVSAAPGTLRVEVEEKDLHRLRPGLAGKAQPVGYPGRTVPARLAKVVPAPIAAGKFEATFDLEPGEGGDAPALLPGMACNLKLPAYRKDDALTVPESAVFSDDDGETHHVYLPGDEPRKRPVVVGETARGRAEILGGLEPGDAILAEKPEGAK